MAGRIRGEVFPMKYSWGIAKTEVALWFPKQCSACHLVMPGSTEGS